ncbi:MAG: glycoside hydrolase family 1 protein [Actinobacteria bacterium]|nr:glycoside hydrolase family 1 protein [Actinomycetota bacterium]
MNAQASPARDVDVPPGSNRSLVPDGFLFGVATAGFQIEGGFNGPDEPRNNWFRFESEGRVVPSGIALDFWNTYESQLDHAVAAGANAFRFSVEWARCEPAEGEIDDAAMARYADIIDACRERGLEPLVTLHHFTHPHWAGEDFWLDGRAPERFARWAQIAAAAFAPSVRHWVTINEWNILAIQTYVTGDFPPARTGDLRSAVRSLDHLLAAHVLAYDAIHAARSDAIVSTNGFAFSTYGLERLGTDVLTARLHGVPRADLRVWLASRRSRFEAAVDAGGLVDRTVNRVIDLDRALPRTVAAVYDSPHTCTLDHVQTDFYNPDTASHFRPPGHRTAGGRHWAPDRMLWDDPVDPDRFGRYLTALTVPGLELWVVENGLCNRRRNGVSLERSDGWDRPRYLQAHLGALVDALDSGVAIGAYFHWCLADNYEWGSYEPCFGLYGVDRERGCRWMRTDAMGHDSAGAFRALIEGLTSGDRGVLTCAPGELAG